MTQNLKMEIEEIRALITTNKESLEILQNNKVQKAMMFVYSIFVNSVLLFLAIIFLSSNLLFYWFISLVVTIIFFIVFIFKSFPINKEMKLKNEKIQDLESDLIQKRYALADKIEANTFTTYVAGTNYRQKELKLLFSFFEKNYMLEDNIDYSSSKKELLEYALENQQLFKYEPFDFEVNLIPESTNEHDPNAIAVYFKNENLNLHLGFIPKKHNKKVLKYINNKNTATLLGGRYKVLLFTTYDSNKNYYTPADYTLKKDKRNYFINLKIEKE